MSRRKFQSPHRVVALVNSPQSPFELAIASEIFGAVRPGVDPAYQFVICTNNPGTVDTLAGYPIGVAQGLAALESADTIVIPGWEPTGVQVDERILRALVRAHSRGTRLVSICSGAFVLAQTGLLDGRSATAHWRHAERFAAQYPPVRVEPDVLYIDHGDVATSAGTAAGLDLCLHLVSSDLGNAQATRIARHMVMPPHREGGQRQYAETVAQPLAQGPFARLLDWAAERLDGQLDLPTIAEFAHVSPRTIARRFEEQLGVSPGKWILQRRLELARGLLETSELTIEAIATRSGLSSATNLRRRFNDMFGTTPSAYRRAFRFGAEQEMQSPPSADGRQRSSASTPTAPPDDQR
ncbi:MAG: GlxA family transcriptional regulator [Jatrophihabitans sp.]